MKLKFFLFFLFFLLILTITAQENIESSTRNTFFFEAGGNSPFYSLNYDYILKEKEKWKLSGRVGLMYVNTFTQIKRQIIGMPLELSYLRGRERSFLEIGIGFTTVYDNYYLAGMYQSTLIIESEKINDLVLGPVLRLGYRYQKREGGLFYKIGFTPLAFIIVDLNKAERYKFKNMEKFAFPWLGAAIGWTLKGK